MKEVLPLSRSPRRTASALASRRVAVAGIAVGLSAALLLSSGLLPVMTYAAPLAAGLVLVPVVLSIGRGWALLTWVATALLTLLLGADKEAALFYLFVGWYPAVKWTLEGHVRGKWPCLLLKALIFSLCLAAMYSLLAFVLHTEAVLAEFSELGTAMSAAFFVLMLAVLLVYDRLIGPLTVLYVQRIEPRIAKAAPRK